VITKYSKSKQLNKTHQLDITLCTAFLRSNDKMHPN